MKLEWQCWSGFVTLFGERTFIIAMTQNIHASLGIPFHTTIRAYLVKGKTSCLSNVILCNVVGSESGNGVT